MVAGLLLANRSFFEGGRGDYVLVKYSNMLKNFEDFSDRKV